MNRHHYIIESLFMIPIFFTLPPSIPDHSLPPQSVRGSDGPDGGAGQDSARGISPGCLPGVRVGLLSIHPPPLTGQRGSPSDSSTSIADGESEKRRATTTKLAVLPGRMAAHEVRPGPQRASASLGVPVAVCEKGPGLSSIV